MILSSDEQDPLLAEWQYGLGRLHGQAICGYMDEIAYLGSGAALLAKRYIMGASIQ